MDIHRIPQLELDNFVGIEGFQNYNNFFHPNLCHVCKTTIQRRLIPCSNCHMISYCSEQHKMLHWPQHKEICEAIGEISKSWKLWDTRGKICDEWLIFRKFNVLKITRELDRELEPYEEQMFMFAKSCLTCHQQYDLVIICEICYSVNSCIDHNLNCVKHDCADLKLSLMLDVNYLLKEPDIKRFSFYYDINMSCFPHDITSFLLQYTMDHRSRWPSHLFDYYYSDWISEPLTMCQIMLDSKYQYLLHKTDFFIVHIIAGDRTDMHSWLAWEILLHLLYPGITIKLIIIDANSLNFDIQKIQICSACDRMGKNISIHCRGLSYEDYMRSVPDERPDVIVGFHADLDRFSQRTIRALNNNKCPMVLTTTSKSKSDNNVRRLQEVLGVFAIRFTIIENKFQSSRPYRDYEGDRIFLRNQYLVICNSVDFLDNSTQASSSSL